jgi:DNA-binding transcriptional LysR family regulator
MIASMQGSRGPRWDDVRLFLALYRGRTLAAAARAVGQDASTLSRRLVALEDVLHTRLFDRTREGLVPLEGADLLLPAAEEMAQAHARFSRDAGGFDRAAEGTVRLSVPPGLAEAFVGPALARLRRRHPGIRVELEASLHFADLTRREADLAIRTRRPQTGDLVSLKLGERRWIPVQAVPLARRRTPVKDWGALAWIGWGDDMASFPPARWIAAHVPRAAVVLRTSHVASQAAAAAAGLGAVLLPPAFARVAALAPVRAATSLAPSLDELPTSETWLVGHRALRAVPRVAAVWSFLVQAFARFEAPGRQRGQGASVTDSASK